MALVSSKVAAGMTILADHFNKLREDLTTHHDHTAGQGGTVAHSSLSDGVISGTALTHDAINTHVQGANTDAAPDSPGGDQGVHSHAAAVYVAGSLNAQLVLQAGSDSSGTVAFPTAFATILAVTTGFEKASGLPMDQGVRIESVTTSGFSWTASGTPTLVHWIAVGTK